jgi:two-component system chemotaxis sensor kinase CheA
MAMSDFEDFRSTFFEECAERLADLEDQLARLASDPHPAERINGAFRAIHSIKGGAGAFGFAALVAFAHAFETLLSEIRDGRVVLTEPGIALCLRAADILADHVRAVREGAALPAEHGGRERAQLEALARGEHLPSTLRAAALPTEELDLDFVPVLARLPDKDDPSFDADTFAAAPLLIERGTWEIRFVPHPELYARANDPLLLFRELGSLGELTVAAQVGALPALADFDPFAVYCSWDLTLVSATASEAQIREVFEFVEGICDLTITELVGLPEPTFSRSDPSADRMDGFSSISEDLPTIGGLSSSAMETAALESETPSFGDSEEDAAAPSLEELTAKLRTAPRAPRVQEPAPDDHAEVPAPANTDGPPAAPPVADLRPGLHSIRVDVEKVDRVVDTVGELVITQSMLMQQLDEPLRLRHPELVRGFEILSQATRGLQDAVMAIRAMPIKSVFSRMPRVIRELSQQTGKAIRLETRGDATEVDKTVIEQLGDPLMHMIRNCADHGIESAARRRAAGKPEVGTIRLSAEQAGGHILITVEDDGGGIDRTRVLEVARERGLMAMDARPNDDQIDALIFAPGFTTASAVSDISGRGVGLDVVVANLRRVGGSVQVRSRAGQGTRMVLRLPLTLAVLDVMQVCVGEAPYVIPLASILQTLRYSDTEIAYAPGGAALLRVRDDYVRLIDLGAQFGARRESPLTERFIILCEADGAERIALVVDGVAGQQQVVVKSLEQNFEHITGIAGGTILGDGSVALIVDVRELHALPDQRRAA